MEGTIQFDRAMWYKILEGKKICTARREKHGHAGDILIIEGTPDRIELISVQEFTHREIAERLYECEGCSNTEEYLKTWSKLYPRHTFVPTETRYVHFFRLLPRIKEEL